MGPACKKVNKWTPAYAGEIQDHFYRRRSIRRWRKPAAAIQYTGPLTRLVVFRDSPGISIDSSASGVLVEHVTQSTRQCVCAWHGIQCDCNTCHVSVGRRKVGRSTTVSLGADGGTFHWLCAGPSSFSKRSGFLLGRWWCNSRRCQPR